MIITIVGPTGVGKTKLSLELAKKYNGEVINADSTQIYQDMNIGTAKISDYEGITHHLIDMRNLNDDYTIYDFQKDGRKIINEIQKRNKTPIIVGGSGLYLSALLYDYELSKEKKIKINKSHEEMFRELNNLNIEVDFNNHQRIERLYLKHIINEVPLNKEKPKLIYDTHLIGLTTSREELYKRINNRVDEMINEGLLDEVKFLFNKYPDSKQLKKTIGYQEFIPYLNNEITLEEAILKIKQNSRNYAKRQYTWFNNKMDVIWFETNYQDFEVTIDSVKEYLDKK